MFRWLFLGCFPINVIILDQERKIAIAARFLLSSNSLLSSMLKISPETSEGYHDVLSIKLVQVVRTNTRFDNLFDLVQDLLGKLTSFSDLDYLHGAPDHRSLRYLVWFPAEGVVWLADVLRAGRDLMVWMAVSMSWVETGNTRENSTFLSL